MKLKSKIHHLSSKISHLSSVISHPRSVICHLPSRIKRNRRKLLPFAIGTLLILLPVLLYSLYHSDSAQASWWQGNSGNHAWLKRQRLTITNSNDTESLAVGTTIAITVNTKNLVDSGKLQSDCDDLRIVYQSGSTDTELTRYISYPGGSTCSTSEATKVYFQIYDSALAADESDTNYYMYYNNPQAETPTSTVDAFDTAAASALLVCPFDGTTDCVNSNGLASATTSTGAIRYSGSKSALRFDGNSDSVNSTTGGISGLSQFTVETWVRSDKWNSDNNDRMIIQMGAGMTAIRYASGAKQFQCDCTIGGTTYYFVSGSDSAPNDSNWHHIALDYDGISIRWYIDGTQTAEQTGVSGNYDNSSDRFNVGGADDGHGFDFNGVIDEVRISTVSRYAANFTPVTSPLVRDEYTKSLYHFDENGEVPYGTSLAFDDSGNGNDGTITGAKYVAGLVGVDSSASDTGKAAGGNTFAGHEGIFIEEATTNKITNPSFENATYGTNWSTADGTVNYDSSVDIWSDDIAKRTSPGPFTTGLLNQGHWPPGTNSTNDAISIPTGNQISGAFYQNIDSKQGSIVFWYTPEVDIVNLASSVRFFDIYASILGYVSSNGNVTINFYGNGSSGYHTFLDAADGMTAGNTYLIIFRWDEDVTLDGTDYVSLTINNTTSFQASSGSFTINNPGTIGVGGHPDGDGGLSASGLFEGFTIYRRPLFDGTYGIDVGNGNEISQIYNSGSGQDPTLVTGSWDVVAALPTDQSTGTLATTGQAWAHPYASNLLYTSTSNTGGFMMNGTYTSDGWAQEGSPTSVSALSTTEKIFAGGYKVQSSGSANEGIYYPLSVTSGDDFVIRALGNGDSSTCAPEVLITQNDNTEITHLDGTTGSDRDTPNAYIFTFEAPATETIKVKLINTATTGTCYWHQIEVLTNLIDNPSMERVTGTPDPWIPDGWTNNQLDTGDTSQGATVHSGSSSLQFNAGAADYENARFIYSSVAIGEYASYGAWTYGNGTTGVGSGETGAVDMTLQNTTGSSAGVNTNTSAAWAHKAGVFRILVNDNVEPGLAGQSVANLFADDMYFFKLTAVTLTVTPADETNSTETSGLRVDGADTLTQTVTNLTDKSGEIIFEITPRHSFSTADLFGFTNPVIASIYGDSNDYIKLVRQDDSTLRVEAQFNGTSVNADWSSPTLNAGTTYIVKITYLQGGNLSLSTDGTERATGAIGSSTAFSTVPTTIYFGSDNSGTNQYDLTVDDAAVTAATPSENTTAPYYKFGSKSAKIDNSSGDATNWVISIDPNSTSTHTVSAYVYDATSGNVGGTVDSKVAALISEGQTSGTTYTDMGGGWWRLTYTDTSVSDAASNFGLHVTQGKTVYVDGVQLEAKAYATTYADGSLGTGYAWTGTANASTSTRTTSTLAYATSGNISKTAGSTSFWIKSKIPAASVTDSTIFKFMDSDGTDGFWIRYRYTYFELIKEVASTVYPLASVSKTPALDEWVHVVATWDTTNGTRIYINNSSPGNDPNTSEPAGLDTNMQFGWNSAQGAWNISDFRILSTALTSTEVADLYYSGLVSHSDQYEVDAFSEDKGQNPIAIYHFDESYGSVAHDSTPYGHDLTLTGTGWSTLSADEGRSQLMRNLKFDGSTSVASRSAGLAKDFNMGTDNFSLSTWFRHPSTVTGTDTLIAKYDTAGYKLYMNSSGYICFGIDDDDSWGPDDSVCTTTSYADSKWHQIEAIRDTSVLYLYIDGLETATSNIATVSDSLNNTANFAIGVDSDESNFWDGFIDEVYIYPYARSADQVKGDVLGSQTSTSYGQQSNDPLTNGLVGYWKMDETATPSLDSSGNGNSGTWSNTSYTTGKFGNSALFDSTADYIDAGSGGSLDNLSNWTQTFWVYPTAFTEQARVLCKGNSTCSYDGNSRSVQIVQTNGNVLASQGYSGTDAYSQTSSTLSLNTWTHVTATFNASDRYIRIYFNGVEQGYSTQIQGANASLSDDSSYSLIIGNRSSADRAVLGRLDEARIYNRALSPGEIQNLYNWAPGPVGYWKMNEGSGASIYDSSGNGSTATFGSDTHSPVWTTAKFGKGIKTDGIDDYASIPHNSTLNLGATTDSYTVEAWLYKYSNGDTHIINKQNSPASVAYRLEGFSNGRVGFYVRDTSGNNSAMYSSAISVPTKTWFHLVGVRDVINDKVKLYVDGVLKVDMTDPTTATCATATDVFFGSASETPGNSPFDGIIDEVKVYNYARTPAQIVEDMNAGHPAPGSPVGSAVGHWDFDEGYGTTTHNTGSGGSSLDGTLGGMDSPPTSTSGWSNSGKFGKTLHFDSSNDRVSTSLVTSQTDNIAFSAWVYWDGADGNHQYIYYNGQRTFNGWSMGINANDNNELNIVCENNTTHATNTQLPSGTWTHILNQRINGTWEIYLNGRKIAFDGSATCTPTTPATRTVIGNGDVAACNYAFNGPIDEVQFFNFALTQDQINLLYNQGQAAVMGTLSTESSAGAGDQFSSSRAYCIPGDTTSCEAPVAEYTMDEKTGIYAHDSSSSNNTGTLTSGPTWKKAKIGTGVDFDGSDDYIDVAAATSINNLAAMTVEAWVYPTGWGDSDYPRIITKGATHLWLGLYNQSGASSFEFNRNRGTTYGSARSANGTISLNTWQHLSFVFDSNNAIMRLYKNGAEVAYSGTPTAGEGSLSDDSSSALVLGNRSGSDRSFQGTIDNVRIFNYARTPAQIAWDYNRGAPVAQYDFDECSGSTLHDVAPKPDRSSTTHDGTIVPGSEGYTGEGNCSTSASTMWYTGRSGKYSSSLEFDGSDDAVSISSNENLNLTASGTITAWIYPHSQGENSFGRIVDKSDDTIATNGYAIYMDGSPRIITRMLGSQALESTANSTPYNQWTHVAWTFNGTNWNIYVNGDLNQTYPRANLPPDVDLGVTIGNRQGATDRSFDGQIDDVKIFNYALTAEQIKTLYNYGTVNFGN